jgi:hypothetical protein
MDSRQEELQRLIVLARSQGWSVERTESGHIGFYPADASKSPVHTGTTPSDHRALKNLRAQLRRAGLRDERKGLKQRAAPPVYVPAPPHEVPPAKVSWKEERTMQATQEAPTKVVADDESMVLSVHVPAREVQAVVEFKQLSDMDLMAVLTGAQKELLRRAKR